MYIHVYRILYIVFYQTIAVYSTERCGNGPLVIRCDRCRLKDIFNSLSLSLVLASKLPISMLLE